MYRIQLSNHISIFLLLTICVATVSASGSCQDIFQKYSIDSYGYVSGLQSLTLADWNSYTAASDHLNDIQYINEECRSWFSPYSSIWKKIDEAIPILKSKLDSYLANEEKVWQEALSTNNSSSYQNYLFMYPNGKHKEEASMSMKNTKSKLDYDISKIDNGGGSCVESRCLGLSRNLPSISSSSTIDNRVHYIKYLEAYAQLSYFLNNCGCASWEQGVQAAKPRAMQMAPILRDKLQEFIAKDDDFWRSVSTSSDTNDFLQYLSEYPDGKHFKEANAILYKARSCGFSDQDLSIISRLNISPSKARSLQDSLSFSPADMLRLSTSKNIGPDYDALHNLRMHLSKGFTEDEYLAWRSFNENVETNASWKAAGFNPTTAQEWWNASFQPDSALIWLGNGFQSSEASEWRELDLSPAQAKKWRDAGYSVDEARIQIEQGVSLTSAISKKKVVKQSCSKVLDLQTFYSTNPYDVVGKCYEISAKTLQLITRTTALFTVGDRTCHITFASESVPPNYFQGIVKGTGIYQYINTIGVQQIVPKLSVISVTKKM